MDILGVIPARAGSKGIIDKNTYPLLGKPLISYTIEAVLNSKLLNRIVVSTNCKKVMEICRGYNIEFIERPEEYCQDNSPIEDSLHHVMDYLKEKEGYVPEIIVLLLANMPIRKKGIIDDVIDRLIKTNAESVVTVYEINQRPEWMKRLKGDKVIRYMNCDIYRRQDLEPLYLLDGAVLAIKREVLLKTRGKKGVHIFLGEDVRAVIQPYRYSVEVDDEEDLRLAEFYLKYYINEK